MPRFDVVALTPEGVRRRWFAAAADAEALVRELDAQGLVVERLRVQRTWRVRQRVRGSDRLLFVQEFAALLRAGLPVVQALELAHVRPDCPALGASLAQVLTAVRQGLAMSQACSLHGERFDPLLLAALRAGEKTGDLVTALLHHAEHLQRRQALQRRLSQALTYPVFLLLALVVVLGAIFVFVLPRFAALYADVGAELPWPTRALVSLVGALPWALALGAAMALLLWHRPQWRAAWIRQLHGLPGVQGLRQQLHAAHTTRSLSALLAAGTPLLDALQTLQQTVDGPQRVERLARVTTSIREGGTLSEALRGEALLTEVGLRLVAVGEATGALADLLGEAARFYEERVDASLQRLTVLMEPLLMLVVGTLVGGVIVAMYLPIFGMADVIR